jgi:flavin reductase (DIM6/NTAB) family NADH-FMN oxidoreductase RutF
LKKNNDIRFRINNADMKKLFIKTEPENIKDNPIKLIGSDWMLVTAGTKDSFNTMTAAWGGIGYLWNKPVVFCFIRPTRHTYHFMEKSEYFTLSFFDEDYRELLNICGNTSGRDTNKIAETGLIPVETENKNIYFEQARLVMECRKLYHDDLKPEFFLDERIHKSYPAKDYHRLYIAEIVNCLVSE